MNYLLNANKNRAESEDYFRYGIDSLSLYIV